MTFTGASSDAAIVLATLVIPTLYAPLRKRLEKVIDKRFKYETRRFELGHRLLGEVLRGADGVDHGEDGSDLLAVRPDATGAAVVDATGAVLASAGTWPVMGDVPTTRVVVADHGPIRAILVAPGRGGRVHAAADLAALEEVGRLTARAALLRADPVAVQG